MKFRIRFECCKMEQIPLDLVPKYLKNSSKYENILDLGEDTIDVPSMFYKENDKCENFDDLELLFSVCSYWCTYSLPETMYKYVSNDH